MKKNKDFWTVIKGHTVTNDKKEKMFLETGDKFKVELLGPGRKGELTSHYIIKTDKNVDFKVVGKPKPGHWKIILGSILFYRIRMRMGFKIS